MVGRPGVHDSVVEISTCRSRCQVPRAKMARVSWRKSHRKSGGGSDQELIPTLALLS